MIDITLQPIEKQSKGRNGWFTPARASVVQLTGTAMVSVKVWSKRQTGEPPIDLYLTQADAEKLGLALLSSDIALMRAALRAARPLIARCGDWQCDHDGHVNCAFGLIRAVAPDDAVAREPQASAVTATIDVNDRFRALLKGQPGVRHDKLAAVESTKDGYVCPECGRKTRQSMICDGIRWTPVQP